MEIFVACVLFVVGLALIVFGGDFFVDAATWMAKISGLPNFVIGATIVSVATTLPELIVSVMAAANGSVDIAIGNAIGSVTANTGLIMGTSLIFAPFCMKRSDGLVKSIVMLVAITMLLLLSMSGELNMWLSLLLLIPFGIYIAENVIVAKKSASVPTVQMDVEPATILPIGDSSVQTHEGNADIDGDGTIDTTEEGVDKRPKTILINILKFIGGAVALVFGADLLVDNGTLLATAIGVSEGIIAVTLVAIGTSLPELVTMITSLVKKNGSMSVGNILGANIIDITMILPICSMVAGGSLTVGAPSIMLDMPCCLAIGAIALIPSMFTQKFSRWQGILMVLSYIAYLVMRMTLKF